MPLWISIYYCAVLALLGAVMGSFICCAAGRYCRGESFLAGRSHCDSCGHALGVRDLVPVFSYLLARGKCRYCGERIGPISLGAEIAGALAFALVGAHFSLSLEALQWLIFAALLLALSLTDIEKLIIPDTLLIFAAINRLFWALMLECPLSPALLKMLIACAVPVALLLLSLLLDRLLGRESLGGGDIKLLLVMALYLDWISLLLALLIACINGLISALSAGKRRGEAFPFGPFLAAGCLISECACGALVQWYLGLF